MKHNILNKQKEVVRNKQKENKTINHEQHLPPCFCNLSLILFILFQLWDNTISTSLHVPSVISERNRFCDLYLKKNNITHKQQNI